MEQVMQIILVALGSSGLMTFAQFLISRNDKKAKQLKRISDDIKEIKDAMATKEELNKVNGQINNIDRQLDRVQLNLLIKLFPERAEAIMKVAKRYFVEEGGNWYLGELFINYCKDNNIDVPIWYKHND